MVNLTPQQVYAIAAHIPCDAASVRKWAKDGDERRRMKPANVVRIERAVAELGYVTPAEARVG